MRHKKLYNPNESNRFFISFFVVVLIMFFVISERNALHKNMEKVVQEMQDTKDKCEELRGAKQVI